MKHNSHKYLFQINQLELVVRSVWEKSFVKPSQKIMIA